MKLGGKWVCFILGLCASSIGSEQQKSYLTPIYEWAQLEFDYPSQYERQRDIDAGIFIPGRPAPIDVDVYYPNEVKKAIFVTIPRFQQGSPIALGKISSDLDNRGSPIINAYPSWEWHRNPEKCNRKRIVSVYRVLIDECERMWVLDNGRLGDNQTCPPQLLLFDLRTDRFLHSYEIPTDQVEPRSILVTPIVDIRDGQCQNAFVYIADCQTYSLIVYDYRNDRSWKMTDKTMYPDPAYGTYSILGDSFDLMDGILGMTISPYIPGQDRVLYYHAMSSTTEHYVFTSDLQNRTRFLSNPQSSPEIFHTYKGKRTTQSAAEAMDNNGIVYFGLMSDATIGCWNTANEYGSNNFEIIDGNKKESQFASGVKIITNRKGVQELFILTSRFQKVATGSLRTTETNFRILAGRIEDISQYSNCKRKAAFPFRPPPTLSPHYSSQENNNNYHVRPRPPNSGYGVVENQEDGDRNEESYLSDRNGEEIS